MLQGSLAPAAAGDAPHLSAQQHPAFPSSTRSARGRGPGRARPLFPPCPIPGAEPSDRSHPCLRRQLSCAGALPRVRGTPGRTVPIPSADATGYAHPALLRDAPTSPGHVRHAAGALCPQLAHSGDSGATLGPAPRPAALTDPQDPRTPTAAPLCPAAFPHPSSERPAWQELPAPHSPRAGASRASSVSPQGTPRRTT